MKKFTNRSGFTLIEIIVVLIIVGILAAIALPNLFSNVQKSKGAEAVASFGSMKAVIEGCGQKNASPAGVPNYSTCTAASLGTSGNFTYYLAAAHALTSTLGGSSATSAVGDPTGYVLFATNTGDASSATNFVEMARTSSASITCQGYGIYAGIC